MNLTLGENGILKLAQKAGKDYQNASMYEQNELEKLYAEMLKGDMPENTPKTEAGTKVRLPDEWKTGTPNYVETKQGEIVKESVEIATVEAVAVGNGEIVPVPIGFYYVGGNLSSGVVISDNIVDQNKYAGQADVPSGLKVDENRNVINELVGNQFVWIPCEIEEYKKSNIWNGVTQTNTKLANAWWETKTESSEKVQIKKYGGFYVGRYEAGLGTTIEEYTTAQSTTSNIYNVEGIPQSKAGIIPWNFIDWTHAQSNAESMYNTGTVNSGLITGTQWDVMINRIGSIKNENNEIRYSLIDPRDWGNYSNTSLTYIGRNAVLDSSKLNKFSSDMQIEGTKSENSYTLLTTGASEKAKAYNTYDVAGNLWEWTEEVSLYSSSLQCKEIRGGRYDGRADNPVCYRAGDLKNNDTYHHVGFRVVLYIK